MATPKSLTKPIVLLLAAVLFIGAGWYFSQTKQNLTTPGALESAPVEETATTQGAQILTQAEASTMAAATTVSETSASTQPKMQPVGRFLGDVNAPVQMIEFASLTCGHCARFHTQILDEVRVKYVDTGLVRIEFRPFPLNKPALDATKILSCLPDNQFYPFMTMLFQTQDHWAFTADYLTILKQNAKLAGLSDAKFDACLADKDLETKIADQIKADAEKYQVQSTPTFILNEGAGRVVGASPIEVFSTEIEKLLPVAQKPTDVEPAAK